MEAFLKGLTDDSIDRAIACFEEGLRSHEALLSDFDSQRAQLTCHSILRMAEKGSIAMGMVCDIPKFWINLDGLVNSSNLNAIESIMTRVFCMQGALKFHYWLLDVIQPAITRTSNGACNPKIWIDRLATDVRWAIEKGGSATFHSSNYLPNLGFPREYEMASKPFRFNDTEQLHSILTSVLRCWLRFPANKDTHAQLTLLTIILSKSPISILFLDKTWEMYKTPYTTLFGKRGDMYRSRKKLSMALKNFGEEFPQHPFAIKGSLSYGKLERLSELINEWTQCIGVDSDTTGMVS